MMILRDLNYETIERLVESGFTRGLWIGRVGDNTPADRFCVATTRERAEQWCRTGV
jgi:hypothetical protein